MTVATNHQTQASMKDVQKLCAIRLKSEQFPRELKQLTGENIASAVKLEFPEIILLGMKLRGVGAQKFS
ncbi:hypothetical protein [Microcoleus vaginatus]|uniref:hypothetical protein n=1 Tax=Microcoleus vaginatus TaxID=119532 RepID=UPI0032AC4CD0